MVANPGMPRTQIHLVVEQFEIVGAHIQHDWQHPSWMDPGGRGVHGQFADGDFDSADALIPNPQNAFGVSGNNQVHVIGSQTGVAEGGLDALGSINGQVDTAGSAELVTEPFDRQSHRGRVHHRQHFGDVLGQQPVKQHLVAVSKVGQVHPLPERVGLLEVLGVDPAHLDFQSGHPAGQQTVQTKSLTFVKGERRPAVNGR